MGGEVCLPQKSLETDNILLKSHSTVLGCVASPWSTEPNQLSKKEMR